MISGELPSPRSSLVGAEPDTSAYALIDHPVAWCDLQGRLLGANTAFAAAIGALGMDARQGSESTPLARLTGQALGLMLGDLALAEALASGHGMAAQPLRGRALDGRPLSGLVAVRVTGGLQLVTLQSVPAAAAAAADATEEPPPRTDGATTPAPRPTLATTPLARIGSTTGAVLAPRHAPSRSAPERRDDPSTRVGGDTLPGPVPVPPVPASLPMLPPVDQIASTLQQGQQVMVALQSAHQALAQAGAEVERLNQLLGLVQGLARVGVWQRDLRTLQGHWDGVLWSLFNQPAHDGAPDFERVLQRVHPEDRAALRQAVLGSRQQAGRYSQRFRVQTAIDQWRHLHLAWEVQADAQGRPARAVGIAQDESELMSTVRSVDQAHAQLRLAVDLAGLMVWQLDSAAMRLHTSEPGWALLGLPPRPEGVPLTELSELLHPEDLQCLLQIDDPPGVPQDLTLRLRHPQQVRQADAPWRVLLTRRVARVDAQGRLLSHVGVALDITERHQSEQRLHEAAERAALAARGAGIATWESEPGSTTAWWDEQMFRLRGRDARATPMLISQALAWLHPDDRPALRRQMEEDVRSEVVSNIEFRVVWPDGSVRWLASRSAPLRDAHGRMLRRIGINWDITEGRAHAAARQDKLLAQRESLAKSRFLARMSHELRTPLHAVLGFVQLMLTEEDSPLQPDARERMALVQRSGEHLLAVINDAMELSSLESGELPLRLQPVAWSELAVSAWALLEPQSRPRAISLHHQLPADCWVQADPVRLRQVMLNLLSNAIKYNRDGGRVLLDARRVGGQWCLAVSDTGQGMTEQQLGHLFEPFNRLGQEAGEIAGTGIGLAIVRAALQRMGGEVSASSQPGRGSRFELRLPACAAETAADTAPTAGTSALPAGPVGRSQAVELGRDGLPSLFEDDDDLLPLPQVTEISLHADAAGLGLARDGGPPGEIGATGRDPSYPLTEPMLPPEFGLVPTPATPVRTDAPQGASEPMVFPLVEPDFSALPDVNALGWELLDAEPAAGLLPESSRLGLDSAPLPLPALDSAFAREIDEWAQIDTDRIGLLDPEVARSTMQPSEPAPAEVGKPVVSTSAQRPSDRAPVDVPAPATVADAAAPAPPPTASAHASGGESWPDLLSALNAGNATPGSSATADRVGTPQPEDTAPTASPIRPHDGSDRAPDRPAERTRPVEPWVPAHAGGVLNATRARDALLAAEPSAAAPTMPAVFDMRPISLPTPDLAAATSTLGEPTAPRTDIPRLDDAIELPLNPARVETARATPTVDVGTGSRSGPAIAVTTVPTAADAPPPVAGGPERDARTPVTAAGAPPVAATPPAPAPARDTGLADTAQDETEAEASARIAEVLRLHLASVGPAPEPVEPSRTLARWPAEPASAIEDKTGPSALSPAMTSTADRPEVTGPAPTPAMRPEPTLPDSARPGRAAVSRAFDRLPPWPEPSSRWLDSSMPSELIAATGATAGAARLAEEERQPSYTATMPAVFEHLQSWAPPELGRPLAAGPARPDPTAAGGALAPAHQAMRAESAEVSERGASPVCASDAGARHGVDVVIDTPRDESQTVPTHGHDDGDVPGTTPRPSTGGAKPTSQPATADVAPASLAGVADGGTVRTDADADAESRWQQRLARRPLLRAALALTRLQHQSRPPGLATAGATPKPLAAARPAVDTQRSAAAHDAARAAPTPAASAATPATGTARVPPVAPAVPAPPPRASAPAPAPPRASRAAPSTPSAGPSTTASAGAPSQPVPAAGTNAPTPIAQPVVTPAAASSSTATRASTVSPARAPQVTASPSPTVRDGIARTAPLRPAAPAVPANGISVDTAGGPPARAAGVAPAAVAAAMASTAPPALPRAPGAPSTSSAVAGAPRPRPTATEGPTVTLPAAARPVPSATLSPPTAGTARSTVAATPLPATTARSTATDRTVAGARAARPDDVARPAGGEFSQRAAAARSAAENLLRPPLRKADDLRTSPPDARPAMAASAADRANAPGPAPTAPRPSTAVTRRAERAPQAMTPADATGARDRLSPPRQVPTARPTPSATTGDRPLTGGPRPTAMTTTTATVTTTTAVRADDHDHRHGSLRDGAPAAGAAGPRHEITGRPVLREDDTVADLPGLVSLLAPPSPPAMAAPRPRVVEPLTAVGAATVPASTAEASTRPSRVVAAEAPSRSVTDITPPAERDEAVAATACPVGTATGEDFADTVGQLPAAPCDAGDARPASPTTPPPTPVPRPSIDAAIPVAPAADTTGAAGAVSRPLPAPVPTPLTKAVLVDPGSRSRMLRAMAERAGTALGAPRPATEPAAPMAARPGPVVDAVHAPDARGLAVEAVAATLTPTPTRTDTPEPTPAPAPATPAPVPAAPAPAPAPTPASAPVSPPVATAAPAAAAVPQPSPAPMATVRLWSGTGRLQLPSVGLGWGGPVVLDAGRSRPAAMPADARVMAARPLTPGVVPMPAPATTPPVEAADVGPAPKPAQAPAVPVSAPSPFLASVVEVGAAGPDVDPLPPLAADTVLYVEDHAVNLMIVRQMVSRRPHLKLVTAATGLEGLALARARRPALILLDMQLPDIDGFEVLRRLRADPLTARIPCMAVSANALQTDIQRALAAGCVEYWTKPLNLQAFLGALDKRCGPPPPSGGGGGPPGTLPAQAGR